MVDLTRLFTRARRKAGGVAASAPGAARHAASEARSVAVAVGEVLDERSGGRLGDAVAKGGAAVDAVAQTTGEVRDAFREEASRGTHRPEAYRPDPIDAPAPIAPPEPL